MRGSPLIANDYLQSVIRPVRRAARFWWVGLAAFLIVIAATLTAAVLTKQYRSEAVVYYREGLQWTTNEGMSTRRIGQRLKDVLLARAQLAKVIEELGLYPELVKAGRIADAVEEMRLATGFKVTEGDIFVISCTGNSPLEAQRVTAKLTDVLIEENARLRSEQAEIAREFLDAEKKRNAAVLGAKEVEQLRFLAKHPEFVHEQSAIGASLRATTKKGLDGAGLRGEGDDGLGALRRERERLRRQISSPGQIPRAPRDPALVAAKNEAEAALKRAQRELADRRAHFTEQHPDVRTAKAMVKETGDAYLRAVDAIKAGDSLEVEPRAVLEARLGQVQQDITAYERKKPKEKAAPDEPVESADAAQRIVALETEWARLNREVAEARERFQQLDSRQFVASMVASTMTSGQAAQIVVIDPAFLPAQPIGMSTTRRFLMGFGMAFAFGIGLAMLFGWLDDRVHDHADIERLELAPILIEVASQSIPVPEGGGATDERAEPPKPLADALAPADMTLVRSLQHALLSAMRDAPQGAPDKALTPPSSGGAGADAGPDPDRARAFGATEMPGPQLVKPESASRDAGSVAGEAAQAAAQLVPMAQPSGGPTVGNTAVFHKTALENDSLDLVRVHRAPLPRSIDPRLLMLSAPDSPAAASFRVLRHRLGERKGVKVLLVASPRAGEGKTLCAVNLALALGEAGRARVLLLEANYRCPSLARLLGFRPLLCVSEQLELHRTRPMQPWVVVESVAPWLHVAAVEPDTETRPLLDGPALKLGIEKLRRAGYDYIVIDSPAILGSADVNLIEEAADGILMTMWAGKSSARALRKAVEQIGSSKLVGIALLGT